MSPYFVDFLGFPFIPGSSMQQECDMELAPSVAANARHQALILPTMARGSFSAGRAITFSR
jgi:hypothetical protein